MAREKRTFIKRKRRESELDITSLLDILVILLVFLLKSYNSSELKVNVVDNLNLPSSESRELGSRYITIQVNDKQEIYFNEKLIGQVQNQGDEISFLAQELKNVRSLDEEKNRSIASGLMLGEKNNMTKVNLLFDGKVSFDVMNKVMHTAAISGYPQFKFIVKGDY